MSKVLIIEDEHTLLDMYTLKLQKEGFEVVQAMDGETGLELAKKEKPDLIMLDIMLPKIDGFAVLESMKQENDLKNTPIILLTNLAQEEDLKKGKDMGAADYLVKSDNTPAQVAAKIKTILNK